MRAGATVRGRVVHRGRGHAVEAGRHGARARRHCRTSARFRSSTGVAAFETIAPDVDRNDRDHRELRGRRRVLAGGRRARVRRGDEGARERDDPDDRATPRSCSPRSHSRRSPRVGCGAGASAFRPVARPLAARIARARRRRAALGGRACDRRARDRRHARRRRARAGHREARGDGLRRAARARPSATPRSAGRDRRHRRGEPRARRPLAVAARHARAAHDDAVRAPPGAARGVRRAVPRARPVRQRGGARRAGGQRHARHAGGARRRSPRSSRAPTTTDSSPRALSGRATVLAFGFTAGEAVRGPPAAAGVHAGRSRRRASIPIAPETGYTANLPVLQRAATAGGHLDPTFDADGVVRRVPMVKRYGDGYYAAFVARDRGRRRRGEAHPPGVRRQRRPRGARCRRPARARWRATAPRSCRTAARRGSIARSPPPTSCTASVPPDAFAARSCSSARAPRACSTCARRRWRRISPASRSTRAS